VTNKTKIPVNHANIKLCPTSIANIFNVLCGFVSIKETQPELFLKLRTYAKLMVASDDEQLDRIIDAKFDDICDSLIGTLAEFNHDQFRDVITETMIEMEDDVENNTMSEGSYKVFCDVNKELLGIINIIDKYANKHDDNTFGLHVVGKYGKFAPETDRKVMDIYIY